MLSVNYVAGIFALGTEHSNRHRGLGGLPGGNAIKLTWKGVLGRGNRMDQAEAKHGLVEEGFGCD